MKRLLTLEDLVKFCMENNFSKFSSKETGYKVVVQTPAVFEIDEENSPSGLLRVKLKVCHTGLNRNGSFVSEDNMLKAIPSLKNRPILAHIHQLDNGEWDFESHNMEIIEENGEQRINYIEKQVGSFTEEEPYLEYDKENDKTYVIAYGVIPTNYTRAAEILRMKNGSKNSCELHIERFSYNAKERYLELEDFYFEGSTLLGRRKDGKEITEGMAGSRADIAEFSQNINSIFGSNNEIEPTDNAENAKKAGFNINDKEGGELMFDELLKKYGKTIEDIEFDYSNLSEEELTAKFEEIFGEVEAESESTTEPKPEAESSEEPVEEPTGEGDDNGEGQAFEGDEPNENNTSKSNVIFELSFDDIGQAINALCGIYRNDDEWCYVQTVYDSYFIMCDWDNDKFYKQAYVKDGDNISLSGERTELYPMFVTESEKLALEDLRAKYAVIETELNAYKKQELDAEKEKVFADKSYAQYIEQEEFKTLISEKDNYSLEELRDKAEIAFAKCVKKTGVFEAENQKDKPKETVVTKHLLSSTKKRENRPYGKIFDNAN